jgi:ABC-2 type transport system permease protein
MQRYLRLYLYFLRFSFSRAMEFRLDFFFRVGMDTLWYVVNLAFFAILFGHTGILAGWTFDQILIFCASYFLGDAIHMTVFANNMWGFPLFVNRGDLDYHLVRPVSSLYMLSLRDFAANSFINLVMAIGILIWALARYPAPLSAGSLIAYLVLLMAGAYLHYVTHMIFLIPVFWLHSPGGLREIYWSIQGFSNRPHRMFTGWVRRILVSILPFAFIVSYPVHALFEGATLLLMLHGTAILVVATLFLVWFWRLGLRAYASASS